MHFLLSQQLVKWQKVIEPLPLATEALQLCLPEGRRLLIELLNQ